MTFQPAPFDDLVADLTPRRAGIPSVEAGVGLIEVFSNTAAALTLRDLAGQARINGATAHRCLVSTQSLSLVLQDLSTTRNDVAPAALKSGLASLSGIDAVKLLRARLGFLSPQIGQTLAVRGNPGPFRVYLEESLLAFAPRCFALTATRC